MTLRLARVHLDRGTLLDQGDGLEAFAAAADTLLASDASWAAIFERLGGFSGSTQLCDVVLISPRAVHVAQRSRRDPNVALLSVAPAEGRVGLVLSAARRELADREGGA